jgi:hypothetical protein
LKKAQFILIHFFLLGMLFTVFQYLPILEEEVPGHRTELVKKVKENDKTGSDDSNDVEDSDNDDIKTEMISNITGHYAFSQESKDNFYIKIPLYKSLISTINTPPPKA